MPSELDTSYPWYSIKSKSAPLAQGDLIDGLAIHFPSYDNQEQKTLVNVSEYDVVVMSQSCDLVKMNADELVILCVRDSAKQVYGGDLKHKWKNLRTGRFIHNHLINKCEIKGYEFDYQIINLHHIITMEFSLLKKQIQEKSDRISMLPPYREFMGQAFARQFMRIGLPNDIPSEYPG